RESLAVDPDRVRWRLVDEVGADEPVVDERVAGAKELESSHGDEPGIARPGSHEVDAHESSLATRSAKNCRRSSYVGYSSFARGRSSRSRRARSACSGPTTPAMSSRSR